MEARPSPQGVLGIVFDGDDTLWNTEQLYDDARSFAREIVAGSGLDPAARAALDRRIDVENVATLGYSTERFPPSCAQAYEEICRQEGVAPDSLVAEWIRRAASSVFACAPSVVSGARETLTLFRARGTRLGLLTKGDHQVQHCRIEQSGFSDLFDVIQIVSEKTPATIQEVVTSLGVEPGAAWMVGNSVRSDVLPAIAAGVKAVWINAHVWEHERTHDHLVDDRVITASSLTELSDLIPQ